MLLPPWFVAHAFEIANDLVIVILKGDQKPDKVSLYIVGIVYEDNVLQFAGQEEGRIRFKPATGSSAAGVAYDYFMKDHLGNVRIVLTEEAQVDQ